MKVYLVIGSMPGHDVCSITYSVHSNKEDAEFFNNANKLLHNYYSGRVEEYIIDPQFFQHAWEKLENAGMVVPNRMKIKY